jgi:DNA-binding NarL/FixJ family response regulator
MHTMADDLSISFKGKKLRLINGRKTRVALLDDHPIVSMGTAALLAAQTDMEVVFSGEQADDLLAYLGGAQCDVAVVDFHLPEQRLDGTNLVRRLRTRHDELGVVVFSSSGSPAMEYALYQAGANGYLTKKAALTQLAEMVRCVRLYPGKFFAMREGVPVAVTPTRAEDLLTRGEAEVLRQLACGLTVLQVAHKLHRSKQTVSTHKRSAMAKLGLNDDLALALYLKQTFGPSGT